MQILPYIIGTAGKRFVFSVVFTGKEDSEALTVDSAYSLSDIILNLRYDGSITTIEAVRVKGGAWHNLSAVSARR